MYSIFPYSQVHASGHSPTSEQNLHRVNLISFSEVLCTTSSLSSSHAAYSIDVTNDGSIFSSTGLPYVIYDSKCMNCSHGSSSPTVCSIKVDLITFVLVHIAALLHIFRSRYTMLLNPSLQLLHSFIIQTNSDNTPLVPIKFADKINIFIVP